MVPDAGRGAGRPGWAGIGPRALPRRRLLAAGATLGSAALVGCATPKAAVQPAARPATTEVTYQFHWTASVPWTATSERIVREFVDARFNSRQRGWRAVLYPSAGPGGGWGAAAATIAASLAGKGPDVFNACCANLAPFVVDKLMLPLETYLRRDNVSTGLWSAGHIRALTWGGELLALPSYDGPQVMGYRQDLLDTLGLAYPDPHWTHLEAAKLWTACARVVSGKQQYGAALQWYDGWDYLLHGFGGAYLSPDRRTCLIDQPGAITAGEWFYGHLFNRVITYRNDVAGLLNGTEVFSVLGGWDVYQEATRLRGVKWDLIPLPRWPRGSFTFTNNDFQGINAGSRHPEQAWLLLKWLSAEPEFQRFLMRTILLTPALNALWSEWAAVAEAVAPPLRGKHLRYYGEAARSGIGLPSNYALLQPTQVETAVQGWLAQIAAQKVSVADGFRQAAHMVNALEAAAAGQAGRQTAARQAFSTVGPPVAQVAPGL